MYITMFRKQKIAGGADYIIPIGILIAGYIILNKLGVFGSGSGAGPGQSSSTATQQQTLSITDTLDNAAQALGNANPLFPNMYNANNNCVSISSDQANSLWADIYAASDPGIFLSGKNADLSGVLAQFQQVVQNQCDVSYISALSVDNYGDTLWDFMRKFFFNDSTGTSGQTNIQMAQAFYNWAVSLPAGQGA